MAPLASGWADPVTASALQRASGLSREAWLLTLIGEASGHSRSPLSHFRVGAAGQGGSGAVYLGTNIEFLGSQLSQTIHAEQAVVINAMAHGETALTALAVSASPCGPCRQFLNELADADSLAIWLAPDRRYALAQLLPQSFGPRDLGLAGGLLAPQDHRLTATNAAESASAIAAAAVEAANRSYAPYTRAYAGCALELEDGSIWSGSYVENAAFNPSLSPGQTALVGLTMAGRNPRSIRAAVLAMIADNSVDHRQALAQMLVSLGVTAVTSIIELVAK